MVPTGLKYKRMKKAVLKAKSQRLGTSAAPDAQLLKCFGLLLKGNEHCFDQVIFKDANKCVPFLNC